ncbi:hypothetical protein [Streptomyces diastaticus]|uniref:hypothetical protein n=1 Tax=Streptomyces diastaticus TaxID=1956 RepID=UPI0033DE965F
MPHMLTVEDEHAVTENKKVVVPGLKSGDHHSEKKLGGGQKNHKVPPGVTKEL